MSEHDDEHEHDDPKVGSEQADPSESGSGDDDDGTSASAAVSSDDDGEGESASSDDDGVSEPVSDDEVAASGGESASRDDERTSDLGQDHGPPPIKPLWQRLAYARPPLWYRVAQVLLPPMLAAGAVGVHWWLNVPERILESPKDQGAKPRGKQSREKKDRRTARRPKEQPRTRAELDEDWEVYRDLPFDEEPTRSTWARRNQALINRAMVVARRAAFDGAPEEPGVMLATAKCRTIRCRFVLRSSYPHELDVMSGALERLESKDRPVWRTFESQPTTAPEGLPSHEHYLQITVALNEENTDTRTLKIPSDGGDEGEPDEADAEEGVEELDADGRPEN